MPRRLSVSGRLRPLLLSVFETIEASATVCFGVVFLVFNSLFIKAPIVCVCLGGGGGGVRW